METSLLEFYRELSTKSEEIGRLKALVEMKDQTIAGLTALLGMNGIKASSTEIATASSLTEQFPSVEHACSCGKAIVSAPVEAIDPCSGATVSTPIESATERMEKTLVEILEKAPRKLGRPKGSKNKSASSTPSTSSTSVEELRKSEGGTVFKDFVPLELDGTITSTSNSHAYMPPEKKNSVLTVV